MSEEKKPEYKFNFKEDQEEVPLKERVIEKRGSVVEFTMVGIENDINNFLKMMRETKGNIDNKQAVLSNIDMHHPFVKEMSEFDRATVYLYQEAFAKVKANKKVLENLQTQFDEYLEEIGWIKEQIPELKDIESPYKKCMQDGCESIMSKEQPEYCPTHATSNKTAEVAPVVYDGPMGTYKITGKADYCDEFGTKQGELEIGSEVNLPKPVGDQFVKDGVAEDISAVEESK